MKRICMCAALAVTSVQAAYYTEEPDLKAMEITSTISCMSIFNHHVSSHLGYKAGLNAQAALAKQLAAYPDPVKVADAVRSAVMVIEEFKAGGDLPHTCWRFIPEDHGLSQQQMEQFIMHGVDK